MGKKNSVITEQDLVKLLTKRPPRDRRKKTEPGERFSRQFEAEALAKALGEVDLNWVVRELKKIYKAAEVDRKLLILDRFRELLVLGALQDEELFAAAAEAKGMKDPFKGDRTLRLTRRSA